MEMRREGPLGRVVNVTNHPPAPAARRIRIRQSAYRQAHRFADHRAEIQLRLGLLLH